MSLLKNKIELALEYSDYQELIEKFVSDNQTSGPNQTETLIGFTQLNLHRIQRIEKTVEIEASMLQFIQSIHRPLIFLAIAEAWCGDVAQNLPVIQKMVAANPAWQMRIVWRDEHHDLMNSYLTNGGMAIPKVIVVDALSFEELAVWGPRPAVAQELVMEYKRQGASHEEFSKELHLWYARNKGEALQAEWKAIFENLK